MQGFPTFSMSSSPRKLLICSRIPYKSNISFEDEDADLY